MDEFLRQFLMFFAATPGDEAPPAGGGSGGSGEEPSGGNEPQNEPSNDTDEPSNDTDEPLEEAGKKALQAERDARKQADKRVAELESQLAQEGSANETALKEALETAKQAQDDLAKSQLAASRYKVAGRFGISTDVAEGEEKSQAETLLTGATEEDMIKQAEIIQSFRKSAQEDALVDPTQGGGGRPAPIEPDPGTSRMASAFDAAITNK